MILSDLLLTKVPNLMLIIEHLKLAELIPINLQSKVNELVAIIKQSNEVENMV